MKSKDLFKYTINTVLVLIAIPSISVSFNIMSFTLIYMFKIIFNIIITIPNTIDYVLYTRLGNFILTVTCILSIFHLLQLSYKFKTIKYPYIRKYLRILFKYNSKFLRHNKNNCPENGYVILKKYDYLYSYLLTLFFIYFSLHCCISIEYSILGYILSVFSLCSLIITCIFNFFIIKTFIVNFVNYNLGDEIEKYIKNDEKKEGKNS